MGECRFVCDVCKKNFESGSKLEDHYRRHTGERPFQCHVCGNKFRYKGDRTKHLKNLHGITKSTEPGSSLVSQPIIVNGVSKIPASSTTSSPGLTTDKTPFLPAITEETNSSVSSLHSDSAVSLSSGTVGESPHKFDPLDVGMMTPLAVDPARTLNISNGTLSHLQETVTMSIDEVMQYAQPIADFTTF